jgi:hypothetical protein
LVEHSILEVGDFALESLLQNGPINRCNLEQCQQFPKRLMGDGTRHRLNQKVVNGGNRGRAQQPLNLGMFDQSKQLRGVSDKWFPREENVQDNVGID